MFVTGAVMANPVLVGAATEKSIKKEISTWMRNWRDRAGGKEILRSFVNLSLLL